MTDFDSRVPFTKQDIRDIINENPDENVTPFYIYDEARIRQTARDLKKAFSWVKDVSGMDFKNFFAVKANPNPSVLEILHKEGMGADCSSEPELEIANIVGLAGEEIMFTSNNTKIPEYFRAYQLDSIINLDDIKYVSKLERALEGEPFPELVSFRYNPGDAIEGNKIIGNPKKGKYGVTDAQLIDAYKLAREKGATEFGLHTMMVSNSLDTKALIEQSRILFKVAARISKDIEIDFKFINLGGGVGIPYRPEDVQININEFSQGVKENYEQIILGSGMKPPQIVTECGRAITGPHGWLVSEAINIAEKHRFFVGLDSCMADLMRPGMYSDNLDPEGECYHHVSILGKENEPKDHVYDVIGSLCEGCDVFARQRRLPKVEEGDLVAIHEGGAHARAMGFNYNAKLRCGEFLLKTNGTFEMVRRREKMSDYFATLSGFKGAKYSELAKLKY